MNASTEPGPKPRANAAQTVAQAARRVAGASVKTSGLALSAVLGPNGRHLPTCSQSADEAFARHGFWAGGWMTLARVLRCHPFGTHGLDFVPDTLPSGA